MDEILLGEILRKVSMVIGTFGVLVGLDLIFGARLILTAKRFLDRAYNLDKAIAKPRTRMWLGIIMIFISLMMLLLIFGAK